MPGSESAILRGEIAKLIGENVDIREALVLASSGSYAKDGKIAALEATIADVAAGHADMVARLEAWHADMVARLEAWHADMVARLEAWHEAETAEMSALAERRKKRTGDLEGRNDELAKSDRCYNGPHSPSPTNLRASERRKRAAAARKNARQAVWRPPGRSAGHPGATRKMDANMPVEYRLQEAIPSAGPSRYRPRRTRCGAGRSWPPPAAGPRSSAAAA